MNIQAVPSPNYWEGRTQPIKKIIIHWMVGTLQSTDATFSNPASEVSAHYGIENDIVHKYVNEGDTAFHAMDANPFSIGIEHSAQPGRLASDSTYETSIELCTEICVRYNLNPDLDIEPHKKYVATECPGTIDLDRIKQGVKKRLGGSMDENKITSGINYIILATGVGKLPDGYPKEGQLEYFVKQFMNSPADGISELGVAVYEDQQNKEMRHKASHYDEDVKAASDSKFEKAEVYTKIAK